MIKGEKSQYLPTSEVLSKKEISQKQNIQDRWPEQFVYENLEEPWPNYANQGLSRIVYSFTKRIIDIIVASIGLILSLPLIAIIAYAIKLDSAGPVFFRQKRIGKNRRHNTNGNGHLCDRRNRNLKGKPFYIYKFRTMTNNVESYAISPNDDSDARLTPIGKIIRSICLDELPQLLNVLKGEMSLVGPRPEMPFIVKNYRQLESLRLAVKPGITGLWQLYGSRKQHIHENLQYDLEYIKNRSLKLDLKIMIKTIGFMLRSKNV